MEQRSFEQLKNRNYFSLLLQCAKFSLPYELSTDASEVAVGDVLTQTDETGSRSVAFCLRKLKDAEQGYYAHERQLLAIVSALRTWQ